MNTFKKWINIAIHAIVIVIMSIVVLPILAILGSGCWDKKEIKE